MEFFFVRFIGFFRKRIVEIMNDGEIDYVIFNIFKTFVYIIFL